MLVKWNMILNVEYGETWKNDNLVVMVNVRLHKDKSFMPYNYWVIGLIVLFCMAIWIRVHLWDDISTV